MYLSTVFFRKSMCFERAPGVDCYDLGTWYPEAETLD